jgi:hypothetical protein
MIEPILSIWNEFGSYFHFKKNEKKKCTKNILWLVVSRFNYNWFFDFWCLNSMFKHVYTWFLWIQIYNDETKNTFFLRNLEFLSHKSMSNDIFNIYKF